MSKLEYFQGNLLPDATGDLFGFTPVAERVASAILEQTGSECFVLGVEGEWGAGKSSLLAILDERLAAQGTAILRFDPWVIGSRDALLGELFSGLEGVVAELEKDRGDTTRTTVVEAKTAIERFRDYSRGVAAVGRVAGLAGMLGVPAVGLVGEVLVKTADAMKEGAGSTPLTALKKRSSEALKKLSTRIAVLIDDIDRLDPAEAVEVLRLVQSVADFPNVTYVLCYDRRRLADGITSITGVKDGSAYLEKIVQVVVPVPFPQPAALREMFTARLKALTGIREVDERLASIILNHVGPRLRTPRAIVRAIDALRLLWPGLKGQVDLADLVWLQFVRAQDEALYRWIEEYAAEAESAPASFDELAPLRKRLGESLAGLLGARMPSRIQWSELRQFLPLVAPADEPDEALFIRPEQPSTQAFLQGRLSSLDHSRLYFGLMRPPGAMTDAELRALLDDCRAPDRVAKRLRELAETRSRAGASKLEVVLDQLDPSLAQLDDEQVRGFVKGLLSVVDRLPEAEAVHDKTLLRRSLGALLGRLSATRDPGTWSDILVASLDNADAAAFLTTETSIDDKQAGIPWAGEAAPSLFDYLAQTYYAVPADGLIAGGMLSKVLRIWSVIDSASYGVFLDRVYEDDELVQKFVTRFHDRYMAGDSKHDVLSTLLFRTELDQAWGAEKILHRLEDLAASDPAVSDALSASLKTLRMP